MDRYDDPAGTEDGDIVSMSPRWQWPRPPRPVVVTSAIVLALACGAGAAFALTRSSGAAVGHSAVPGEASAGQPGTIPAANPAAVAIRTGDGAKVYVPGRGVRFVQVGPRGQDITGLRSIGKAAATGSR
jgi:hypothetical protein